MAKLEAARDAQFMVMCRAPDVCKTPPYGVPVPYQIVALSTNTIRQSQNVKFKGNKAKTMNSRISRVMGDEPGVMGGVMSNVNMGMCRPINGSTTLRVNGHRVLYDRQTLWWMNCAGPEGPGNTIGTTIFLGATMPAKMGPTGPPPGDPEIQAEIPAEKGFIDKLTSVDGIASLSKMAPQLATMDWSNPMGVLGAFGGLAGAGGFGQLAGMAGMASKAVGIAMNPASALGLLGPLAGSLGIPGSSLLGLLSTNWKNPGSVIGAASNLAGGLKLFDDQTSSSGTHSAVPPAEVSSFDAAKKRFENEVYVWGKTDCSAAVREVYPEFSGLNSAGIKDYLEASPDWNSKDGYADAAQGDVLHFPGHVEIVTGRGTDHRGRPAVTVWGCRTADSQGKNGGCGEAVFSDDYLTKKDAVIYGK